MLILKIAAIIVLIAAVLIFLVLFLIGVLGDQASGCGLRRGGAEAWSDDEANQDRRAGK